MTDPLTDLLVGMPAEVAERNSRLLRRLTKALVTERSIARAVQEHNKDNSGMSGYGGAVEGRMDKLLAVIGRTHVHHA